MKGAECRTTLTRRSGHGVPPTFAAVGLLSGTVRPPHRGGMNVRKASASFILCSYRDAPYLLMPANHCHDCFALTIQGSRLTAEEVSQCQRFCFIMKSFGGGENMILAFHKPYGVLSQFRRREPGHRTLAEFGLPEKVYPIGRLDADSEGLLLLSDEKEWNDRLLHPRHGHERTYHAQVEGIMTEEAAAALREGILIQGRMTLPCRARILKDPGYPPRNPPVRFRLSVPTSWIELKLTEGRNRQVRRMTAAAGFPTLRLIRVAIGGLELKGLAEGCWRRLTPEERELLTSHF